MPVSAGHGISPIFGPNALAYAQRVLSVQRSNLIAYWPMWERSGSVADNLEGTAARDGAYTGVTLADLTLPNGDVCPLFDAANDYLTLYTSSLNSAFDGAEGTILIVYQPAAGALTDATLRYLTTYYEDGSNLVDLRKTTNNNQLQFIYNAGGTPKVITWTNSSTDAGVILCTWSATADEVKVFTDGSQEGSTATALGTWAGSTLESSRTLVGARTNSPIAPWDGWLAHAALWSAALTADEAAYLGSLT